MIANVLAIIFLFVINSFLIEAKGLGGFCSNFLASVITIHCNFVKISSSKCFCFSFSPRRVQNDGFYELITRKGAISDHTNL